ncbi:MAG: ROK family protein [Gammaproteobacteria bacterium]|nr:MAG: ROK family protein [Gammaproteobacteria bacterium]
MRQTRLGIDLGGTKIEGALLAADGTLIRRLRIPTPQGDYQGTLAAIASLVERLDPGGDLPVGIGTPGSLSPASGLLRNANSTCLNGRPLLQDLIARLNRTVRIANDADCFALSEAVDGAARDARTVFGVIIGTGTGAGIVVDGQLLAGPNAIAGEWGHNPLPWPTPEELPGPPCYCGKRGCIETYLSGPGMTRDHGGALDAPAIVAAARDGEPAACATLDRYCDRLARALASVINVLDPEAIVLGGGMGQIEALYHELPLRLPRYLFSDTFNTRILRPQHGDASGVRGAAWLWPLQ